MKTTTRKRKTQHGPVQVTYKYIAGTHVNLIKKEVKNKQVGRHLSSWQGHLPQHNAFITFCTKVGCGSFLAP